MLYDGWAWGAIAAIALLTVDTGGGGHVGGDAQTGRDLIGRDNDQQSITFNNYIEQKRRLRRRGEDDLELPGTLEEVVEWQQLAIFGSKQLGVTGLRDQTMALEASLRAEIARLRFELIIGRAVVAALALIVFIQAILSILSYTQR